MRLASRSNLSYTAMQFVNYTSLGLDSGLKKTWFAKRATRRRLARVQETRASVIESLLRAAHAAPYGVCLAAEVRTAVTRTALAGRGQKVSVT